MIELDIQPILTCPTCTYNQFFPTWIPFVAARLLAVLIIGFRSFDIIRLLGLFTFFELTYHYAWKIAIWHVHPAVSEGFFLYVYVYVVAVLILMSGIPAMLIMQLASRFQYFTKLDSPEFSWRRASALLPLLVGIALIEVNHASSQSS